MCKAPKPPKPKEPEKPQFLRNRYLDEVAGDSRAVNSLRQGRSSLRIDLGGVPPIRGRQPGEALPQPTPPRPTGGPRPGPRDIPRGLPRR